MAKLLAFIEYLFEQWYVKRHDDDEKLDAVVALAGIGEVKVVQEKLAQKDEQSGEVATENK